MLHLWRIVHRCNAAHLLEPSCRPPVADNPPCETVYLRRITGRSQHLPLSPAHFTLWPLLRGKYSARMSGAQGPNPHPTVRQPAVAGMFYPADPQACRDLAATYVRPAPQTVDAAGNKRWIGGIVPHAGWICSAAVAGQTLAAIGSRTDDPPELVVVFGAVHTPVALE